MPEPNWPDDWMPRAPGLVRVGGDLTVETLLQAYGHGEFPWTDHPVTWWSPDPRAIIEIATFQPPRSVRRLMRSGRFTITRNQAFADVIAGCAAAAPGREETWISPEFVRVYTELHRAGYAHSVECWQDGELAGGIYGVSVGGLFAGESMFHRVSGGSKVALCALVEHLRQKDFRLFDVQMRTPVTTLLGAAEIPRQEYLRRLAAAVGLARCFD